MRKKDITDYVFPYYKFNNERWVRLSDVNKFKTYLIGQLILRSSPRRDEMRLGEMRQDETKTSSKKAKIKSDPEVHFTKPS